MYPVSSDGLNTETDDAVAFFTPAFHPLDNFSAHRLRLWGQSFPTAEHAFQWKKYAKSSPAIARQILDAVSPHQVKQIADHARDSRPADWHDQRVAVMREILTAKSAQHADVRECLQRTGKRTIIENSPVDAFWGVGPEGSGANTVGRLWMEIRDKITRE